LLLRVWISRFLRWSGNRIVCDFRSVLTWNIHHSRRVTKGILSYINCLWCTLSYSFKNRGVYLVIKVIFAKIFYNRVRVSEVVYQQIKDRKNQYRACVYGGFWCRVICPSTFTSDRKSVLYLWAFPGKPILYEKIKMFIRSRHALR